ncbi:predicted protein [Enterococcus gallinarum EG2]|nr:predicted protein [Enterococcus gallinarum EG2]
MAAFPQYPLRSILLNLSVGHWELRQKNERVDLSFLQAKSYAKSGDHRSFFVYATVISIKFPSGSWITAS